MGTLQSTDVDEFVHTLIHEYDPVKAREYYLRTRQLKGRTKGSSQPEGTGRTAANRAKSAREKLAAERKAKLAKLEAKLRELESRLDQLNAAIKQAKAAAMRRAGNVSEETLNRMISAEVKSPGSSKGMKNSKPEASKKGEDNAKPEKKTAAEKKEAAKAAREKYEKEEKGTSDNNKGSNSSLQEKVDNTAKRVEKLQQKVKAIGRIGR